MHNGHNAMTIACWPLASGAKNERISSCEVGVDPIIKKSELIFLFFFLLAEWGRKGKDRTTRSQHIPNLVFTVEPIKVFLSLPKNKMLDLPKLKRFADDSLYVTHCIESICERVDNIMGKRENAGHRGHLVGKATSGLERILCEALVKRN